ncbi:MAG: hypothetical protein AAGA54_11780 [Myxococcota bacterium]
MDRQPPRATSNAIDLYIRTYYSLLRSSGDVRVRAFEEAHVFSESSLHAGARDEKPDVAAFAYAAARLPGCMPAVGRMILGQSSEQFRASGFDVSDWTVVTARGRRRPNRWSGGDCLAVYITSATDIDDLVPIVTAYQLEWNKMHRALSMGPLGTKLAAGEVDDDPSLRSALADALGLEASDVDMLWPALGPKPMDVLESIAAREVDLSIRLIAGTLLEYRRATQRWWFGIESAYRKPDAPPRPVYFVSSNTHVLVNLLGGYARTHRDEIFAYAREANPEGLADDVSRVVEQGDEDELNNFSYYLLRQYLHADAKGERIKQVQAWDAAYGLSTLTSPGHLDVNAQLVELSKLKPEGLDPRVRVPGLEALAESDAVIINIDYPLGMAAYHHLTQLAQGVADIRGIYVMGKAATLNGRVGDVMLSTVAYDEHSENTYLFRNCFAAEDIAPYVHHGTVLDNQKALTVRGAFLQNHEYMSVFYREGYTVLEMEAGPYLSAVYEMVYPKRHPKNEVVHLSNLLPFEFGLIHYGSDTPYSKRQSLLSKSLSYFGMDSTYGCAVAITRRILAQEIARLTSPTRKGPDGGC